MLRSSTAPTMLDMADEAVGLAGGLAIIGLPLGLMAFGAVGSLLLLAVPLALVGLAVALAVAVTALPALAVRRLAGRVRR